MGQQITALIVLAPVVCGAIYFIKQALGWRAKLQALEPALAKARADLAEKEATLETAKAELIKFTGFLEKRMDTRTAELKAAQEEIEKLRGKPNG
jgi:hypothetical protein